MESFELRLRPLGFSTSGDLPASIQGSIPHGIEVAGGRPKEAPTYFEITGTAGSVAIRSGAMRGVQSGRLRWFLNDGLQPVEEGAIASMPDAAANLAGVYALLQDDIRNHTGTAPGFEHAVKLAHFKDAVRASPDSGLR